MILSKEAILDAVADGRVRIDPFDETAVGPASIELTLKPEFGVFRGEGRYVRTDQKLDSDITWIPVTKTKSYLLEPGGRLVGKTLEKVSLAHDLCGWVTPRARTAVFSLSLEISSGFIQPGTNDEELFFLITNSGRLPMLVPAGIRICQLVLSRAGG